MRVLILGGTGMLGHRLHERLSKDHSVVSTSRRELAALSVDPSPFLDAGRVIEGVDVTDLVRLEGLIEGVEPDALINCVGIIKQRKEAHDARLSIQTNSLLPHELSRLAARYGARFIHFSTDCVFDGTRGSYTEDDIIDARDIYGRTKALGEVHGTDALTLRTSIIGRELDHFSSLLEWFLQQRGEVRGFSRAIYTGVTTDQLASIVSELLTDHVDLHGLYQVASNKISKYELLSLIRDEFSLESVVELVSDDDVVCDRSLRGNRFMEMTGIVVDSWDQMISALAGEAGRYIRKAAK